MCNNVRTSFDFAPLPLQFTIEHAADIDPSLVFDQFAAREYVSSQSMPDCVIEFDDDIPPAAAQSIYPQLEIDRGCSMSRDEWFESVFDHALIRWSADGRSVVRINKRSYLDSPHYLQNLFLKAFRHSLINKGFLVVHSSACLFNHTGVLVIGQQNAGKSTFSILTGVMGGSVVSDDMLIVDFTGENEIFCRAARKEFVLRERMARIAFADNLGCFEQVRYFPSNETKYVLSRDSGLIDNRLAMRVDRVMIASNSVCDNNSEPVLLLPKYQSLAILVNEICSQYDSTLFRFPAQKTRVVRLIERLNRLSTYRYSKSTDYEKNPRAATLAYWETLSSDPS